MSNKHLPRLRQFFVLNAHSMWLTCCTVDLFNQTCRVTQPMRSHKHTISSCEIIRPSWQEAEALHQILRGEIEREARHLLISWSGGGAGVVFLPSWLASLDPLVPAAAGRREGGSFTGCARRSNWFSQLLAHTRVARGGGGGRRPTVLVFTSACGNIGQIKSNGNTLCQVF